MKKLLIALGLGALMGTSAMALPMSPPPTEGVFELGVDVYNPEICRIFNGKGSTTSGALKNISIAPNGNITMKCSSDGKVEKPSNIPKRGAVIYSFESSEGNIRCLTISSISVIDGVTTYEYEYTDDWQNVVSASGMSSLICHYREVSLTTPAPAVAE